MYHVVSGEMKEEDIQDDATLDSIQGTQLRTNIYLKSKFFPVRFLKRKRDVAKINKESFSCLIDSQ